MTTQDVADRRAFMRLTHKHDLLSEDEERELIAKAKQGDLAARDKVISSHLRLVSFMGNKYSGYSGVMLGELYQEGVIGLINAIEKFDQAVADERGARFSTYAIFHIKNRMLEHALNNYGALKLATTKNDRRLFFGLRKRLNGLKLTPELVNQIALELDVKPEEVWEMNDRFKTTTYKKPPSYLDDDEDYDEIASLKSDVPTPEELLIEREEVGMKIEQVRELIKTLKPRTRQIITERYLTDEPRSLGELGKLFNISAERVRQIELAGLRELKVKLRGIELNALSRCRPSA